MKIKNECIEILTSELKELTAQIDIMTIRSQNAAIYMKPLYDDELYALRTKQHAAAEKLKELEVADGDAWEMVKESADRVWYELRAGLSSAIFRFR